MQRLCLGVCAVMPSGGLRHNPQAGVHTVSLMPACSSTMAPAAGATPQACRWTHLATLRSWSSCRWGPGHRPGSPAGHDTTCSCTGVLLLVLHWTCQLDVMHVGG